MNSGIIGLLLRSGYGLAELRIIKMMKYSEYLMNEFSELMMENQEAKILKNR